jgi:imidazole glycerol-phosphate synthase subunit HisF
MQRLIPVLLLRQGGLYKTTRFEKPQYVGDPVNAVRIFNDKEADELIILDIGATPGGRGPDLGLITEIAGEAFMPVCYGGGVTDLRDFDNLFSAGVEKVAVNTVTYDNPSLIRDAARKFGSQSVVGSIDVHRHRRRSDTCAAGGRRCTRKLPRDHAVLLAEAGVGEILLTSVDREGTGEGYDLDTLSLVSEAVNVPVVANGGAGSLDHVAAALSAGASGAAAGSMFVFEGRHRAVLISYPPESLRAEKLGRLPA